MSARQASQSSPTSSVAALTQPASGPSTRSRRNLRRQRSPPLPITQHSETAETPSSPKDAGLSQPMSSAMSSQSRRIGLSPTVASTTSASSVGGRLREDPLLDLLIEQQEKQLSGVAPLEGGSPSEVEQAARLFLETSRRCFQTSMDAMELEEAEMESDYRSQERDNVMSTWTDMLLAGRVFFDCNQYEVAIAEKVKEDVRQRKNALTHTAAFYLDKAVALFNAIVLVKNINLPDSVATDLEELGAGSVPARVTARNRVLKNLWTSFWHIVPGASSEEMELWVQFSVQLSGRFQSHRVLEEERVRDNGLPKPGYGAFWGKNVFPDYSNLDHSSREYRALLTQWERLKTSARPKSVSKPPLWETFEDSVLEYIRKKSSELLDFEIGEEEAREHDDSADAGEGDDTFQDRAKDASMAEPLDMGMFLELAQELEAEKAMSSPVVRSPKRPTVTPLIRLGPERPTPSFDWNARQKDAVQISWESQESESPQQQAPLHCSSEGGCDELPGETQLLGAKGALDTDPEASEAEDDHDMDSDEELPTMTQLQGGSLAPFADDLASPAGDAEDPDEVGLPPESLLNRGSDALAEVEIDREGSDIGSLDDDDFPTATQLHGYAGAFVESVDIQATILEDEEEDVFPSETQLNGHSNALAPIQPLEPVEEEEEEGSAPPEPESDDFPDPDQFAGDDEALASQVAAGNRQADESQSNAEEQEDEHPPESEAVDEQPLEETQSGLPDMDELAGDYAALNVSEPEEEAEAVSGEGELQESDPVPEADQVLSEPNADGDDGEAPDPFDDGQDGEPEGATAYGHETNGAPTEDTEGDELPSADQLQGEGGTWSDNDELTVAQQLNSEDLQSPSASQSPEHPGHPLQPDALETSANASTDPQGTPMVPEEVPGSDVTPTDALNIPQPESQHFQVISSSAVDEIQGVAESTVAAEVLHAEAAIAALSKTAEPLLTELKTSSPAARHALHASGSRPGARVSLPARFLHPRRPDLTEFATPDPDDGPVESRPSTSSEVAGHLHGPRRVHRLRTDSPTRRPQRYSPPMLLPIVPHHAHASSASPRTPSQAQAREPASGPLTSSIVRSASTVRRIDSQTPLESVRRQVVAHVRSEGAASVVPRRARSSTGRLGYVAPRNDLYQHDEDGGPLEPNPEYVTPDVYPTPPQERAERRTRVPMHRKSRRWTEGEALLLYRTIQKAWWSERTAQQVAWYLHGEWGQMSQRLKAFSVQNMKDKMREIVKTRVRNDRAVVGRARHWLPAGHPDREAYEEEMAAWADAENERLLREQLEEEEDEEERKALEEAAQAEDVEMENEMIVEESQDMELDWEANADLLVDVGGEEPAPQTSEDEDAVVVQATREGAPVTRGHSARRTVRAARTSVGARWRTDNDDEVDELESDQGEPEASGEFADDLSVVDNDVGIAEHADFPPPIDIVALLNSRKRRTTEPQSGTPKRRHTFGAEPRRPLLKPQARPSLPAPKRKPTTYRQLPRPQRELESSESDSSEEEAVLQLPALRTRPGSGTPRSGPTAASPQMRRTAQTEPRPRRRSASAAREVATRGAQSSPAQAVRSRHGPRQSPSQLESESSDHDGFVPRPSLKLPQLASKQATRASMTSQRQSPGEQSSSDDENAQNATIEHHYADAGSSSDGLPDDTQVNMGNTQPDLQVPRTTVVARARRGRGRMTRGPSRPLSVVAERTESVESRMDRPAPTKLTESSSSGVIPEAEEEEDAVAAAPAPEAPPPSQTSTSRLREIARKVMGV